MPVKRWSFKYTHDRHCYWCNKAGKDAKTTAIVTGSNECTYTFDNSDDSHTATATRFGIPNYVRKQNNR